MKITDEFINILNIKSAFARFPVFNFEFAHFPLIHHRRDDGPPSPQRLLCNRGKVGVGVVCRRDDGPPLLGGAAPFSSRQKRATFPAIGKVYPTKLGRAERAKVDFTFQLSIFNLLAPLCTLKNSPRGEMKQKTREEKLK